MPVNSISPSEANDYVQKMNKQYWDNKYDFGQGVGTQGSTASSQGAEVQPANTISPGLLDKMDQEKNSEWWKGQSPSGQQPGTTDESVTDQRVPIQPANSISPGLLDKYDVEQHSSFWNNENFKNQEDYKQALAKVKGDTRFTFNGNEYVRYGGRTYMSQNSIPNVAKLLSQDESERIDHLRSKLLLDKPIQDADGPGASLGAAAGRAAALGLAGTELPAILAGAGTAFVVKSLSNLRKDLMNNRH